MPRVWVPLALQCNDNSTQSIEDKNLCALRLIYHFSSNLFKNMYQKSCALGEELIPDKRLKDWEADYLLSAFGFGRAVVYGHPSRRKFFRRGLLISTLPILAIMSVKRK